MHLAMDTATSDIRAVEFTPSSDGDSPVLPELLDQIPQGEVIGTVTADGAYDTRRCHTAIHCPAVHVYMHERDRPPGHADHPHSQEWAAVERGLPGGDCEKRYPAGHSALRQGVLEALDRISRTKSDRGKDDLAGSLGPVAFTCSTPRPLGSGSPRETRTGKLPKSKSASPS